jgi:ribosome-associated protein
MLVVSPRVAIPDDELHFSFARSSGPGGQNVNKVNSKATLHWHVVASQALPDDIRARFLSTYAGRLTNEGAIVISSQESRDQPQNVAICREKLSEMIRAVLVAPKKRRPTKPTKGSQRRRLTEKKNRGDIKQGRRTVRDE